MPEHGSGLGSDLHQANLANSADHTRTIPALDIGNRVGDVGWKSKPLGFPGDKGEIPSAPLGKALWQADQCGNGGRQLDLREVGQLFVIGESMVS